MTYGFNIPRPQETKAKIDKFLKKQVAFSAELANKGIQPIAVLPYYLWVKICAISELYRFEHITPEGKTGATPHYDLSDVVKIPNPLGLKITNWIISLLGIFVPLFLSITLENWNYLFLIVGFVIILSLLNGIWFGELRRDKYETAYKKKNGPAWLWPEKMDKKIRSEFSKNDLKKIAKENNLKEHQIESFLSEKLGIGKKEVSLQFTPSVPKTFAETMEKMRAEKIDVKIAATSEAIKIMSVEKNQDYATAETYLEKLLDPIIYCIHEDGDMVAITGQYGEFPNEKKVIEWVRNEYSVISFLY
jgi:hypothetical protein